ncbi:MAG: hypothetical protein JXQ75_01005 [Phycisphaerae bacterium]|nr:hypothetical protein [Phycisphaerae bacterium]
MSGREKKWILFLIADRKLRRQIEASLEVAKYGRRVVTNAEGAVEALGDITRTWDMIVVDGLERPLVECLRAMHTRPIIVSFVARHHTGLIIRRVTDIPDLESVIRFHLGRQSDETPMRSG